MGCLDAPRFEVDVHEQEADLVERIPSAALEDDEVFAPADPEDRRDEGKGKGKGKGRGKGKRDGEGEPR